MENTKSLLFQFFFNFQLFLSILHRYFVWVDSAGVRTWRRRWSACRPGVPAAGENGVFICHIIFEKAGHIRGAPSPGLFGRAEGKRWRRWMSSPWRRTAASSRPGPRCLTSARTPPRQGSSEVTPINYGNNKKRAKKVAKKKRRQREKVLKRYGNQKRGCDLYVIACDGSGGMVFTLWFCDLASFRPMLEGPKPRTPP